MLFPFPKALWPKLFVQECSFATLTLALTPFTKGRQNAFNLFLREGGRSAAAWKALDAKEKTRYQMRARKLDKEQESLSKDWFFGQVMFFFWGGKLGPYKSSILPGLPQYGTQPLNRPDKGQDGHFVIRESLLVISKCRPPCAAYFQDSGNLLAKSQRSQAFRAISWSSLLQSTRKALASLSFLSHPSQEVCSNSISAMLAAASRYFKIWMQHE